MLQYHQGFLLHSHVYDLGYVYVYIGSKGLDIYPSHSTSADSEKVRGEGSQW